MNENPLNFLQEIGIDKTKNHTPESTKNSPLSFMARPSTFDEFFGHQELFEKFKFLKSKQLPSLILYGPPGSGKTTLAHIISNESDKELFTFSPVLGGINDLRKLITKCEQIKATQNRESIIFIDEIHRFNKSQQDGLLPYVEKGTFTLIGATTENPRFAINSALNSRVQLVPLKKLAPNDIEDILKNCCKKYQLNISSELLEPIIAYSDGDSRVALNALELTSSRLKNGENLAKADVLTQMRENGRKYDRSDDRHYQVISAFIKSLRGSDPDAALLWLAVMLDGGEDPVFISRRLIIFASEDIGNSDPAALTLAVSTMTAVSNIGMPEARICLAQTTTYLASTVKSNSSYTAIDKALEYVKSKQTVEVPLHLRNNTPECKQDYLYPHSFTGNWVKQKYVEEKIPTFFKPSSNGIEKKLKERLQSLYPERY